MRTPCDAKKVDEEAPLVADPDRTSSNFDCSLDAALGAKKAARKHADMPATTRRGIYGFRVVEGFRSIPSYFERQQHGGKVARAEQALHARELD